MPNITIRIDDEILVRRAKVIAAQRGTSLSALVRSHLEELVQREDEYERAADKALRMMGEGLDLGGEPLSREEAHDRRLG